MDYYALYSTAPGRADCFTGMRTFSQLHHCGHATAPSIYTNRLEKPLLHIMMPAKPALIITPAVFEIGRIVAFYLLEIVYGPLHPPHLD